MSRVNKKQKVIGNYRLGKVLGKGSYGYVKLGVHVITGEKVAIKTLLDPQQQSRKQIQREISILKLLDHPHIVQLHEVIEDPKSGKYYLVLELASGGELFDYIVARGKLREKEARKFFRQIISGVEYCHSNLVVHRDLKPENLLLDGDGNIKINDFGFSNIITPGERFSTFCGSVSYVAPEVISHVQYMGPEIDVWSLGVILYTLVCGRLPWPETADGSPALNYILEAWYDKTPLISSVSLECQDLIAKILIPDPKKRATLQGYPDLPLCLVQDFPPVLDINKDIVDQIVRLGFEEEVVRKRLKTNEHCQEVTMYHLMVRKMNKNNEEAMNTLRRRRVGSTPEFKAPSNIADEDIKAGSGAAARFHKNHRNSHNLSRTYGNGETLIDLVNAMATATNGSSSSPESSDVGSPSSSPAVSARSSPAPMSPTTKIHEKPARPILTGSTSPPSPVRPRATTAHLITINAPTTTTTPSSPNKDNGNGNNSSATANKRRSLVLTNLESAFKSLVSKDKSAPSPREKEKVTESAPNSPTGNMLSQSVIEEPVTIKKRSSTLIGLKSFLYGDTKLKQVSGVFNVDTTTTQSPDQVIEEIQRVLALEASSGVGIWKLEYKLKGYAFKCNYPNKKLKFQLQICRIKNLEITGIKLKRLKGDLWVYKDNCQRLMSKLKL